MAKVEKKKRKRNPAPPFTTSTLQQEASRKLGFSAQRTMRVAQQLYEGIDTGGGAVGLITYMRTDSLTLADDALEAVRGFINERYGAHNLPKQAKRYKTTSKNAQEAHEAIRPTDIEVTPDAIKANLTPEQYKLYDLVWKRTVACQMIPATINTVAVDLSAGEGNVFRATGSTIADPGFMAVYQESEDEPKKGLGDGDEAILPPFTEGEQVALLQIEPHQHFTEPPPRYSEASLVKALEEHGIGRPSTYASIISTLQQREYVVMEKRRFHPTDVARIVNKFLTEYFTPYVDYEFTARLEDELDAVSRGEKEWVPLMKSFWEPFQPAGGDHRDHGAAQGRDPGGHGRDLPQVRQAAVHPARPARPVHRLHGISPTATTPAAWTAKSEPGARNRGRAPVSPVRIGPGGAPRALRQVHRLQQLPQVQIHRAPGEAPGHRGGVPAVPQGHHAQAPLPLRQDLLFMLHLPDCNYAVWNEPDRRAVP